jgi:hypothetical protein
MGRAVGDDCEGRLGRKVGRSEGRKVGKSESRKVGRWGNEKRRRLVAVLDTSVCEVTRRAEGAGGAPESTVSSEEDRRLEMEDREEILDPTSLVELRRTSFECWIWVSHEGAKTRRREDGGDLNFSISDCGNFF